MKGDGWAGACVGQKITAIRYNYAECSRSACGNALFLPWFGLASYDFILKDLPIMNKPSWAR
jgi:hypothetical protein